MHNDSTGQRPIESRQITPVVQKAYFAGAGRLQGRYALKQQVYVVGNSACRSGDNRQRIGPASLEKSWIAGNYFRHIIHSPRNVMVCVTIIRIYALKLPNECRTAS